VILQPPGQKDSLRVASTVPQPIDVYEDGLNDIDQINKDWETFVSAHENIKCERHSDREFQVSSLPSVDGV